MKKPGLWLYPLFAALFCLGAGRVSARVPWVPRSEPHASAGVGSWVAYGSASDFRSFMDRSTSSELYRMTYVALPLIAGGLIVMSEDKHFRTLRNDYLSSFRYHYDDYLQYAPAAAMFGLKIAGVQGRSSWGRMIVSDVFSSALTFGVVTLLKHTIRVPRPDGSNRQSFPSGHTATAFVTATMLHKEYGLTRSPWYSVGGYTLATVTGLSRQLNNKHWLSDVMVGAGIGILSAEVGYWLSDLIFKDRGLTRPFLAEEPLDRLRRPSFFGLYLGFNVVPGIYRLPDGGHLKFETGSNAGVEGAWFWNRRFGLGSRVTVSNMQLSVDGAPRNESLDMVSGFAGVYFSHAVAERWLVGSKLLAGYYYASDCNLSRAHLGGRIGWGVGTGFSMTFQPNRRFGMRFVTDYTLCSSAIRKRQTMFHLLTLGGAANIMF